MARKPLIHAPGAIYHVILRGDARQDIFSDEKDRYRFYEILQKSCERFLLRIHAFCLMTNHIHLEIQVGDIPLSRIMRNVSLRYTQWHNWRHKKSGHVFQGRYKAVMVDADAFLLGLAAYIHSILFGHAWWNDRKIIRGAVTRHILERRAFLGSKQVLSLPSSLSSPDPTGPHRAPRRWL